MGDFYEIINSDNSFRKHKWEKNIILAVAQFGC